MSVGIFELLAGSSSPLLASGDVVCFIDISDATQAAQGSLVKATLTAFFAAIPVPINITSASATAFAVGLTGATNPAFTVDASTALQVAGLKVTGAVTTGTVAIVTTDSGAATNLTINAKGTGTIGIGSVSTGRVTITPVCTITGATTLSAALTYGGVTLSNAVTGTGNMVLSASPTLTGTIVVTGATITGLTAASVGTGTFPGIYTVTGALTLSAALTYGGVTLSNAVTGTGNMVLSASPTLTGTAVFSAISASSSILISTNDVYYSGKTTGAVTRRLIGMDASSTVNIDPDGSGTNIGSITMNGSLLFNGSVRSTTAIATPSAFAATEGRVFASTVQGGVLMGYGTSNDVTLMNRAGTVVLGVGPNTTTVNIPGTSALAAVTVSSTITMSTAASQLIPGATSFAIRNNANGANNWIVADSGDCTARASVAAPLFYATGAASSGGAGTVAYGGTVQTTIGGNGAASALTANPVGYVIINVAGTDRIVPYYNKS